MYQIESDRKIDAYVMEHAYKWLCEKVKANRYRADDVDSQRFLQEIANNGVTEEIYAKFCEKFNSDPCTYILASHEKKNKSGILSKKKKIQGIVSDDLALYFVEFGTEGGPVLPIGFVQEFFEDDYELMGEIEQLYKECMEDSITAFQRDFSVIGTDKREYIETKQKENPGVFRIKAKFHIVNVLSVVFFALCVAVFVLTFPYFKQAFNDMLDLFNIVDLCLLLAGVCFAVYLVVRFISVLRIIAFWFSLGYTSYVVKSSDKKLENFSNAGNNNKATVDSFTSFFRRICEKMKTNFEASFKDNLKNGTGYLLTPDMLKETLDGYKDYIYIKNSLEKRIDKNIRSYKKFGGAFKLVSVQSSGTIGTTAPRWASGVIIPIIIFALCFLLGTSAGRDILSAIVSLFN